MPKERRIRPRLYVVAAGASSLHHRPQPTEHVPPSQQVRHHGATEIAAVNAAVQVEVAAALAARYRPAIPVAPQPTETRTDTHTATDTDRLAGHSAGQSQRRKKEKRAARHSALMNSQTSGQTDASAWSASQPRSPLTSLLCSAVILSGLLLPGERVRRERLKRATLPSLTSLSSALPVLSASSSVEQCGSGSGSGSAVAQSTSASLSSSKQRARLRAVEIQQLAAVCAFEGYRRDPLAVMRQHLQHAALPHSHHGNQKASVGRRDSRQNRT